MKDVNSVVLVCRLTRDPELRHTGGGTAVCSLRVAWSTSWKEQDGSWSDRPNYADVTVWGTQGERCSQYLSKGRQVCVMGRLQWREWQDQGGNKRQSLDIVAEQVQFLGGGEEGGGGQRSTPQSDIPADGDDFKTPGSGALPSTGDDDIPF